MSMLPRLRSWYLRRRMERTDRLHPRVLPGLLGRRDPLILEIGSNDGWDARGFLNYLPSARVICFEPEPRAIANWRKTHAQTTAELHEIAIGAVDGTATFHQSDSITDDAARQDWDKSGSLRAATGHLERSPWVSFDSTIEVPVRRLDTWATEHGIDTVDFIWADVQGAECDLIAGGGETLARTRFFYTEYAETELYEGQWTLEQISAALPNHRLLHTWPDDALFVHRDERLT